MPTSRLTCVAFLFALLFAMPAQSQSPSVTIPLSVNPGFEEGADGLSNWEPIFDQQVEVLPSFTDPNPFAFQPTGAQYVKISGASTIYQVVNLPAETRGVTLFFRGRENASGNSNLWCGFGINFYDANGNMLENLYTEVFAREPTGGSTAPPQYIYQPSYLVPKNAVYAVLWATTERQGTSSAVMDVDQFYVSGVYNTDIDNILLEPIGPALFPRFFTFRSYDDAFNFVSPNPIVNVTNEGTTTARWTVTLISSSGTSSCSMTQSVVVDATRSHSIEYGLRYLTGRGSIGVDYYDANGMKLQGFFENIPARATSLDTQPSLQRTVAIGPVPNASYALFYVWLDAKQSSRVKFDKLRLIEK